MRCGRRTWLVLVGGWLATAAGCARPESGHKILWRTLSRGLTSGLTRPQKTVFRDEVAYLKAWAEHAADVRRPALPPQVDFTREMVILLALGTKPTGGYFIEVVDLEVRGRTLRVLYGEREPQPGELQIQQLTQPYQWIALPMIQARVEFLKVREAEERRDGGSAGGVTVRPRVRVVPAQSPRGAASSQ